MANAWAMLNEILSATHYTLDQVVEISGIPKMTLYGLLADKERRPADKTFYRLFCCYCKVMTNTQTREPYYPQRGGAQVSTGNRLT